MQGEFKFRGHSARQSNLPNEKVGQTDPLHGLFAPYFSFALLYYFLFALKVSTFSGWEFIVDVRRP